MSARRRGWDYAQLRTGFAGDPEFVDLRGRARADLSYLAAVGLWALCLGHAWQRDSEDVTEVLGRWPERPRSLLEESGLTVHGCLRGFTKATEAVRRERQADSDRHRKTPPDSAGVQRIPPDSPRVEGRGSGSGVVNGSSNEEPTPLPPDDMPAEMDGPIAYQRVTTRYPQPHSELSDWCRTLASDYGADRFEAALRTQFLRDHNLRTLLSRTASQLAMEADLARATTPKPKPRAVGMTEEQKAAYEAERRRLAGGAA